MHVFCIWRHLSSLYKEIYDNIVVDDRICSYVNLVLKMNYMSFLGPTKGGSRDAIMQYVLAKRCKMQ